MNKTAEQVSEIPPPPERFVVWIVKVAQQFYLELDARNINVLVLKFDFYLIINSNTLLEKTSKYLSVLSQSV